MADDSADADLAALLAEEAQLAAQSGYHGPDDESAGGLGPIRDAGMEARSRHEMGAETVIQMPGTPSGAATADTSAGDAGAMGMDMGFGGDDMTEEEKAAMWESMMGGDGYAEPDDAAAEAVVAVPDTLEEEHDHEADAIGAALLSASAREIGSGHGGAGVGDGQWASARGLTPGAAVSPQHAAAVHPTVVTAPAAGYGAGAGDDAAAGYDVGAGYDASAGYGAGGYGEDGYNNGYDWDPADYAEYGEEYAQNLARWEANDEHAYDEEYYGYEWEEGEEGVAGSERKEMTSVHHRDDEKLECADWVEHAWVKPSTTKALKHRGRYVYRGGRAPLWGTSIREIAHKVGYGLGLYFQFLKLLSIAFFIMTILALPAMFINLSGQRITEEEQDALSIVTTSLGNNGLSAEEVARQERTCNPAIKDCNTTYINMFGKEITSSNAALIITASDILYSMFFLAFVGYFHRLITRARREHEQEQVTAADYTIKVTGLPRSATKQQILDHFDELFNLGKTDWTSKGICCGCCFSKRGRRPISEINAAIRDAAEIDRQEKEAARLRLASRRGASGRPGGHTPGGGSHRHVNFHHDDAAHESTRHDEPQPVLDISSTGDRRYFGKWVNEVSIVHENGEILRRYLSLKKRQLALYRSRAVAKKFRSGEFADEAKFEAAMKKVEKMDRKLHRAKVSKIKGRVASEECVAAFVTFNEHESVRRALTDYGRFHGWRRFCMPKALRFQGAERLKIQQPAAPSAIIWENLDTHWQEQAFRRCVSLVIMLALLIVSIAVIFVATLSKIEAAKRLPDLSLCGTELPAIAFRTYDFPLDAALARNRTFDESVCGNSVSGKFFVAYPNAPARNVSDPCQDYCVRPDSAFVCTSLNGQVTYERKVVVGCYCKSALTAAMAAHGLLAGAEKLKETEADLCTTFASDYLRTQGLFVLSAVSIVVINALLRVFMRWLAKFERHHSVSAEASSLTLKIFLALVLNTGLVSLMVNANLPILSIRAAGIGIFSGEFGDFSAKWYSVVGTAMCLTMLINMVAPQVGPLLKMLIIQPCKRCCLKKKKVTQEGLNSLYEGSSFEVSIRYPTNLNTLFVALAYSSGLPVLLPVASASFFLSYWIDKISLLRMYSIPPRFDDALALLASNLMPWACLIHLYVGVWMYGNNEILKSDVFTASVIGGNTEEAYAAWKSKVEAWDPVGAVPRLVRNNVLPVFLFAVVLSAWLVFGAVPTLQKLSHLPCCCFLRLCLPDDDDDLHQESLDNPPFSGLYYELVTEDEQDRIFMRGELSAKDKEKVEANHHGGRYDLVKEGQNMIRIRVWQNDGKSYGVPHKAGDRMCTWSVIEEHGLHSYDMLANVKYRRAIMEMMKDQKAGGVKKERQRVLSPSKKIAESALADMGVSGPMTPLAHPDTPAAAAVAVPMAGAVEEEQEWTPAAEAGHEYAADTAAAYAAEAGEAVAGGADAAAYYHDGEAST